MSRATTEADVERVVLRLLAEVLPWQFSKREMRPEMSLQGDLGMESIAKLALAFRIEEELGIDLTEFEGDLADIRTVGEVVAAAHQLVERARSAKRG